VLVIGFVCASVSKMKPVVANFQKQISPNFNCLEMQTFVQMNTEIRKWGVSLVTVSNQGRRYVACERLQSRLQPEDMPWGEQFASVLWHFSLR